MFTIEDEGERSRINKNHDKSGVGIGGRKEGNVTVPQMYRS